MPLKPAQMSDKSAVPHSQATLENGITTQAQPDAGGLSSPATESSESPTPEQPQTTAAERLRIWSYVLETVRRLM